MKEFKSFYKSVGGGEGDRCQYPVRLDLYGKGCQHNCKYCYARALLEFRKFWDKDEPSIADIKKVERVIRGKIPEGVTVRLGGMTDCFQPMEAEVENTYKALQFLKQYRKPYLIVTKSDIVAQDKYIEVLDKELAHIQITVTSTEDELSAKMETATPISRRILAIEKLAGLGFDVSIRVSPYIPQYIEYEKINAIKCDKLLVEFLRVNHWIKKWMPELDYSEHTLKEGGYTHIPLERKKELLKGFKKKEITICEDVQEHFEYFRDNFNPNKEDCCNLRR